MGLLGTDPSSYVLPRSWFDFARLALGKRTGSESVPENDARSLVSALEEVFPDSGRREQAVNALRWFGIVPTTGDMEGMPPLPTRPTTPIDLLTTVLAHKPSYAPGECELAHEIVARPRSSGVDVSSPFADTRTYTSTLVSYGTPRASTMSRCVGLLAVLDGKVEGRGVRGPTEERLYRAVLDGLEGAGLGMRESMRRGGVGMDVGLGDSEGLCSTGFGCGVV
jgi:alpha-aminoadipic semialdehyde synthase